MSSVVLPIAIPASMPAMPAMPALQPGAVMQALVLGLIDDMTMRLQLPGGMLDVKTQSALPAGTRVQVAVEGTAAQPKLVLTPLPMAASSQPNATAPGMPGIATASARPLAPAAANVATPVPPSSPQAISDSPNVVRSSIETAIGALVRHAVGRQNGIAPLMADLETVLARPGLEMPQPVRQAAELLLAQRLDIRAPVGAEAIQSAIAASGAAGADAAALPSVPVDVKTILDILRVALGSWAKADPAADVVPKSAALPSQPALPQQAAPRAGLPAPPHRDGPTVPQPPATTTIPGDLTARETALHLLAKTEGAIARQTLLQIASLPDMAAADAPKSDQPPARVTLDIPLLTPQGNAAAQLRIERDEGGGGDGGETRPVWRATFSIDVEPIGPVHAQVTLHGERAAVTLYAERDDSAARLREGLPILEAGLKDAALEPGDIRCRAGAPSAPRPAAGLFVDQAS